jgi:hypothetical protein
MNFGLFSQVNFLRVQIFDFVCNLVHYFVVSNQGVFDLKRLLFASDNLGDVDLLYLSELGQLFEGVCNRVECKELFSQLHFF